MLHPLSLSSSGALQAAINGVDDGAEHIIVVTGSAGVSHNATVDGGKVIAFVSTNTSTQTLAGLAGNPTLTLIGADTTVFLHRLQLTANTDDVGVSVEANASLFADSVQVSQNSGGGITLAAGTSGQLRNCMVRAKARIVESPASLRERWRPRCHLHEPWGGVSTPRTLSWNAPAGLSIRNSIVVSEAGGGGNEVDCPGSHVDNSALENDLVPTDWFGVGFGSGDDLLTATGQVRVRRHRHLGDR